MKSPKSFLLLHFLPSHQELVINSEVALNRQHNERNSQIFSVLSLLWLEMFSHLPSKHVADWWAIWQRNTTCRILHLKQFITSIASKTRTNRLWFQSQTQSLKSWKINSFFFAIRLVDQSIINWWINNQLIV